MHSSCLEQSCLGLLISCFNSVLQDLIIKKLRERLEQFGHPVEDILSEVSLNYGQSGIYRQRGKSLVTAY